jgi:hypothetical protein
MQVYGLRSPLRAVQLAWQVNRHSVFSFKREEDLHWLKGKHSSYHPVFKYDQNEVQIDYRMIRNRGGQGILFDSAFKADYLLCVRYEDLEPDDSFLAQLKELKALEFVYPIKREQLGEELYNTLIK